MIDTIQITDDFAQMLKSYNGLLSVNVVRYDKLAIQGQIDWSLVYLTKRNNCIGAGVIVEVPYANNRQQNITGPQLSWVFTFLTVENPTINRSTGGTFLKYDIISQMILDCVHLYADDAIGTFTVSQEAITPVELEQFAGCICMRSAVTLSTAKSTQTTRCGMVQFDITGGLCTLTCATDSSRIYYTKDKSFPANQDGGNPASLKYTGPFAVKSGDIIRAVAYANGYNNSVARKVSVA